MNASIETSETGDPRLNAAQKELGLRLAQYRNNDPRITRRTVNEMQGLINDFRSTCKRKGIEFPKLTIIAFLRMNHICVWPAELDQADIQKRLRLFIIHRQRHDLPIDAEDMAKGVRRGYPDYSPSRFNLVSCPEQPKAH